VSILATKRRRDLARQRWQFLAVLVTITLGVMMFAASYDAYRNLQASYRGTHERLAFADATITGTDDALAATIGAIDGVAAVDTRTQVDPPMRVGNDVFVGRVVSMPADSQPPIDRIDVTDGSYLGADHPNGVVVETHMAEAFDLSVGDSVEILAGTEWLPVEVVGIGVSPEYLWPARSSQDLFPLSKTFGVVFATDEAIATLQPDFPPNQLLVRYEPGADTATVDTAVRAAAVEAGAEFEAQADQPANAALSLDLQGFQQLSVAFPALFLLAAGMAALILLNRLVYSQRSQIGTLRASGMSNQSLSRHYLSYGLILGIAGGAMGVILGVAAGWAITGSYTAEFGIPDTIRQLRWITPVVGLVFGVGTGAIAALVPARAAFRLSPAEAMRGDVPKGSARASLIERAIPPLRRLPTRWLMVVRGVGRNWRRSLSTVIGVVLALTLILTSWGMIDTVDVLLSRQFEKVDLADATAVFDTAVGDRQIEAVAAVDGVTAAEPVITLPATISTATASYSTQLQGYRSDTVMHGFTNDTGRLPVNGVLGGAALADELGISPGDTVTVSITDMTSFDTTFAGFVDEPLGTKLYMERGALVDSLASGDPAVGEDALTDPTITTVVSRFDDGVDREATIDAIGKVDGILSVADDQAFANLIGDFMGFFYLFVGVMLVMGGAMAFALIFNTISVNVAERSTEYATMRANGLSSRSVGALITGENVLLTTIGIVPGLIVGSIAAAWFMHSYTSDLLSFDLHMRPSTLVLAALAMIVVALLSVIPGIRTVNRLDLAEVVRERAT
jgi:putative ABC transport system permease protein